MFVVHTGLDGLPFANTCCILNLPMESLKFVDAGLREHLKVEVLQGEVLISLSLIKLIVFNPSSLKHTFKGDYGHFVLFVFLVHFSELLIDQDGLLIIISVLDEVSEILEHDHRLISYVHLL